MIGVQDFYTRLLRIVLVTLIMVTGVSSAAAEARCTMTGISAQVVSVAASAGEAISAQGDSEEENQTPSSSPFHCAFSHACHGAAAATGPTIGRKVHVAASRYLRDAVSAPSTIEPAGAERPPQA